MPLLSNNFGQNQPAFGQQRPGAEEELYINSTPSPQCPGQALSTGRGGPLLSQHRPVPTGAPNTTHNHLRYGNTQSVSFLKFVQGTPSISLAHIYALPAWPCCVSLPVIPPLTEQGFT